MIEVADIPPDVQAVQHTDYRQTKVNYNLAWAKTHLKKAGAIDNSSRGVNLGDRVGPAGGNLLEKKALRGARPRIADNSPAPLFIDSMGHRL